MILFNFLHFVPMVSNKNNKMTLCGYYFGAGSRGKLFDSVEIKLKLKKMSTFLNSITSIFFNLYLKALFIILNNI